LTVQPADLLKKAPFSLGDEAVAWVHATLASLTLEEKLGQLIIGLSMGDEQHADLNTYQYGGITRFFNGDFESEQSLIKRLQAGSKVPLLISADLEGSNMSLPFGTQVPNQLALAAINNLHDTRTVTQIMAQEARAVGNAAFRSAIVATRSYGDQPELIKQHAIAQLEVLQANGIAACAKHWPGEGFDDRDQHLVTTVIPQTRCEWDATFGMLYKAAIEAGVQSIMSAHIAFPDYIKSQNPNASVVEQHRPASISRNLNLSLLRDELGFNGLIVK